MKYRDEIKAHFENGTLDKFMEWSRSLNHLDQVEVLTEVRDFFVNLEALHPQKSDLYKDAIDQFSATIEKYQDAVLDAELLKQEYIMTGEELERMAQRIREQILREKDYIIESIVGNYSNAEEMRDLAKNFISFEKKTDTYNPENWKEILG